MKKTKRDTPKTSRKPPCGLCGKSSKPRFRTECCKQWICGDESDYVFFSFARNICSRNHRRFTLCGFHHTEEHGGDWQTCEECKKSFKHEMEMYMWYGTDEYNFEKLLNPPSFLPTYCAGCKKIIRLPDEGFTCLKQIYVCEACMENGFNIRKAADVE